MTVNKDTLDEASVKVGNMERKMLKKFCPLKQGLCFANCICYNKGRVHKGSTTNGSWFSYGPYCDSPLISGTINVTNNY